MQPFRNAGNVATGSGSATDSAWQGNPQAKKREPKQKEQPAVLKTPIKIGVAESIPALDLTPQEAPAVLKKPIKIGVAESIPALDLTPQEAPQRVPNPIGKPIGSKLGTTLNGLKSTP